MPKKIEPTETKVKKESPKTPAQTAAAKSPAVEPAKPAPAPAPAPKAAEKPAAAAAPAPAPKAAEKPAAAAAPAPAPKAAEKPAAAAAPAPAKAAEKPAAAPAPAKAAEKPAAAPAPAKAAEKPAAAPAKAAKPAAQPESVVTVVVAKYDIGHGNHMFIRGEGAGLSWDSGIQMENAGNDVWVWTTNELKKGAVSFKFLINDAGWSSGDNMTAPAGETTTLYPSF